MGLPDARVAKMENGRSEDSTGVALCDTFYKVVEIADAAARDDGNINRIGNRAREFEVIAIARAVAVH